MILLPHHAHIWLLDLRAVNDKHLNDYQNHLSDDELQRLDNYRNPKVRREQLITRGALRVCLSQYSDSVAPGQWQFERSDEGKPHLVQPAPLPLSFNLSHSGDWLTIAITVETDIGVDIQQQKARYSAMELAQRYFHSSEVEALKGCEGEARQTLFFKLWTLKEAYLKARGTGISTGLDKARFHIDNNGLAKADLAPDLNENNDSWQFHHYHLGSDYCLSLAMRQPRAQDASPHFYKLIPPKTAQSLEQDAHWIQMR